MFEHDDWTLFRNPETLGQKAGVAKGDLPRLVAKELADNGLDVSDACQVGLLPDGGLFVEDAGPGIAGGAAGVAGLFCVRRPLRSSKLIRLPSRGALGNGLRVVCGAVLSTGGRLFVATGGTRYRLDFHDDGTTTAKRAGAYSRKGTRVEVWLGDGPWPAGGFDYEALGLARRAVALAGHGRAYTGHTSAHWYDSDTFFELLQAAGVRTVRDLATDFDGCSAGLTGEASRWRGRACRSLSRKEAKKLLAALRGGAKEVQAARLGCVGKADDFPRGYAKTTGTLTANRSRRSLPALIPFVLEAWAMPSWDDSLQVNINRTPTTAAVSVQRQRERTTLGVFGCGLKHAFTVGRAPLAIRVNVTTPYMPIINDGKTPDLLAMGNEMREVVEKAARCARRIYGSNDGRGDSQKARIEASLDEAVKQASGDGQFEFSIRQLFYVVRPMVADGNKELLYGNFSTVVGDYETEHGPLPGMFRDPRGTLYHPHLQQEIPLGTRAVDGYERPAWRFNKMAYVEKEGVVSILRQARWPERHDCALMSAKGFASRAARDVIDLLGTTGEPLTFFCAHDADAAGTMIYQALQEETAARPARNVKIVNLGLEPWEGVALGLPVESPEHKGRQPVARYVSERDDGEKWAEWLQSHRIELNAMTTPQLIAWLDGKMAEHGQGRLIPPAEVLAEHLERQARAQVAADVKDAILREHDFEGQVEAECNRLAPHLQREAAGLPQVVRAALETPEHAHQSWAKVVDEVAVKVSKPTNEPPRPQHPPTPQTRASGPPTQREIAFGGQTPKAKPRGAA
jgi:hypothetical protein